MSKRSNGLGLHIQKRSNAGAKMRTRLNAQALLDAARSAEACLRLFDMDGDFRISAPAYVDGEEFASNVRIAHIHAARQAREELLKALGSA